MYEIDLTQPAEDASDKSLKDVLKAADLSQFYQVLKDNELTDLKALYKLNFKELVFFIKSKTDTALETVSSSCIFSLHTL